MSAFNFGQPASTGASAGSLFNTTNKPGGNLFGNAPGTAPPSFPFGNQPASTGGDQKSIFGGTTGGPSSFSFGAKPAENKMEPPKTLFGANQPPATPSTSAPSLFGSTTPSAGFKLGNPSTTPAGPPPSQSAFGASTGGSIFGSTTTTSAPASKPAFSFGQPAATSAASASAPAPAPVTAAPTLFGGNTTAGGLLRNKPVDSAPAGGTLFGSKLPEKSADASNKPATEAPKPAFSFGAPPATTSTTTSSPSLFGAAPATATPNAGPLFTKPASAEPPSKPAFSFPTVTTQAASSSPATTSPAPSGGFFSHIGGNSAGATPSVPKLFGAAPFSSSTTTAAPTPASTAGSAPAPSLFSSLGGTTAASTTKAAPASSPFSFGAPASTSASQPSIVTPANITNTTSGPGPTSAMASTATATNPALATSTAGPTPPAQSRLRNKTMDEILTRWATDLTRYAKEFKTHAETIAHWDQIIVDNQQKIEKLYVKTRTCEKQTMSVEMQLAAVENQQTELESWLAKYENDVEEMLAKDGTSQSELGGPDQERERTYKLAEKLGERLDDMGRDLESMVEEVNSANASLSKHTKSDEPITQIVRILNSHLTQLQVIDQGTAQLQAKVTAAQKTTTGLSYLNGSANGDARAAVDDFYRSYMGRR